MKRITIVMMVLCSCMSMTAQTKQEPFGPLPNENQLRWQDMEMYAFIHYSLNTYTDQEWGFGNEGQTITFPTTKVRILKLDADRLAEGTRMGYGDIDVK